MAMTTIETTETPKTKTLKPELFTTKKSSVEISTEESELKILPWSDPVTDSVGYDPRSLYVEMFWLPILGPSCIWLLRRLAMWLEKNPDGFKMSSSDFAQEIGLGKNNKKSQPLKRTLSRCAHFGIIHIIDNNSIYLRQRMPAVSPRLLHRFSDKLKQAHLVFHDSLEQNPKDCTNEESALNAYFSF